jgi:pyridoxal phosphate enzyme (YggS family)
MTNIVESFSKINSNIKKLNPKRLVNIIAVSKTFSLDYIMPLIDHGHIHFGENKVQEATAKWGSLKKEKKHLKLHMVGKLQSNKAKNAGELFDYIHSLDTQKLADVLSNYELNSGKNLKYFIQVNIGNELQKSGIPVSEIENFYNYCIYEKKLDIQGLMVIPPNDNNTKKYFKTMNELNISLGLKELSMGMSSDYEDAVVNNSTFVRIGSLIFGKRS